jgi:hypothetical protein
MKLKLGILALEMLELELLVLQGALSGSFNC